MATPSATATILVTPTPSEALPTQTGTPRPSYGPGLGALDNTPINWGNGPAVDERRRPIDSVKAEKKYAPYDARFVNMESDCLYFTFDEGYENGYTAQILDVLKEKKVKACFFVTGPYARKETELIRRMIDEGHVVGNHSEAHKSMPSLSIEDARADTKQLHDDMERLYGYTMKAYRFPMGSSSVRMMALVQEMGYTSFFWSFAYRDFEINNQPDPAQALERIVQATHPGAVYLLHAVSKTNADILGAVIDALRAKGYTFGDPHELIK